MFRLPFMRVLTLSILLSSFAVPPGSQATPTRARTQAASRTDQPAIITWIGSYGGSDNDQAYGIVATADGGYGIASLTDSFGAGGYDFWVLKLDADGHMLWQKTYGGRSDEYIASIVATDDGGFAAAGYIGLFPHHDFWVLKLDTNGTVQWQKTYGGNGEESAFSLVTTTDGGYAVAGVTDSFDVVDYDIWVLKLDAGGNVQWQKTYGGSSSDSADSIVATADGGYAIGGSTNSFGEEGDVWVLKLDASGNVLWQKIVGGNNTNIISSITTTADGGYAVAGYNTWFGAGNYDAWVLKLDASGNVQWQKTYGGSGYDEFYGLVATPGGDYAVAGSTSSFDAGHSETWVLKLDASGNVIWEKTYGGSSYDFANSLVATGDGGYAVAASTESFGAGSADVWVLKLDANGDAGKACSLIGTSMATVTDTFVSSVSSSASVRDTAATVSTNSTLVGDSNATTDLQCVSIPPLHKIYLPLLSASNGSRGTLAGYLKSSEQGFTGK